MARECWHVLLPREIHPAGPESIEDIAEFTSVSEYDSVEDLHADMHRFDAVIDRLIDLSADIIEAAPDLQVIAKHGVGLDNIDVNAATEHGVVVCNTPGSNARGVAEQALTLLTAVRKRILVADREIRSGTWERHRFTTPELGGDMVGLLGFGNTGSKTGELLTGFGMNVCVYDPYVDDESLPEWAQPVDSVLDLFERSDAVSVHVPLTPSTKDLVSNEELSALADHGIVVNTARGGIVDEDALVDALESGTIAGAGLDVLESEPPDPDNPLLSMDSVVLTPHIGGVTEESLENASVQAAANVRTVYEGGLPETTVNADEL